MVEKIRSWGGSEDRKRRKIKKHTQNLFLKHSFVSV
jgi:hypothetical protein